MEFGLRPQEDKQTAKHTLEQARAAEEYGFDAVYVAEHSGFPSVSYWPSPLIKLSAIAAQTTDIDVGTHVLLLPQYNPVRLAGAIASLDILAEGRTRFGMGIGWREIEFEAHGVPFSERGPRATEYLRVITQLLENGAVSFDGQFVSFDDFELVPEPVQTPRPPIYVGGWSEPAMRRALELGDGWISPGDRLAKNVQFIDEFREQGGDHVVAATEGVVIREDRETALADTKDFLKWRKVPHIEQRNELRIGEFMDHLRDQGEELQIESESDVLDYAERLVEFEIGDDVESYVDENMFVAGDPDDCIDQVEELIAKTDCDELILRTHTMGVPTAGAERTLELLGEQVLPSF